MPHLNETDLVLARAQRLHDAVDAIAGQAEDDIDAPVNEGFDEDVGSGVGHGGAPELRTYGPEVKPDELPLVRRVGIDELAVRLRRASGKT